MKKGDILLVHHKVSPLAKTIRIATNSYWNHVAICVNDKVLIEVAISKLQISPISEYLNKKIYAIRAIRLKRVSRFTIEGAVDHMLTTITSVDTPVKYLCKYSFLLLRHLFKSLHDLKFGGAFTCSEYIASYVYAQCKHRINNKMPIDVVPADFDKEKYKVIKENGIEKEKYIKYSKTKDKR